MHEGRPRAAVLLYVGVFWCSLPYVCLLERWFISSSKWSNTKWQLPEWASFITCGWVIREGGKPAFPLVERRLVQFSFVLSSTRGAVHMWSSLVMLLWNVSKPLDCNSSTQRGGGSEEGRKGRREEWGCWNCPCEIQTKMEIFFLIFFPSLILIFFFFFNPHSHRIVLNLLNWKIHFRRIHCSSVKAKPTRIISFKLQALNDSGEQLSFCCSLCICACVYAFAVVWSPWVSSSLEFKNAFEGVVRASRRAGIWSGKLK